MKLRITPQQLAANPALQQIALSAIMLGTNVDWLGSGAEYYLDSNGELYISHEQVQICLDAGVEINEALLYSPVVSREDLQELVPADWDGALKPDPEDEEATVQKTWAEYTHTYDFGEDQCCVTLKGPMDANNNLLTPSTNEKLRAFITQFGGFMTRAEFLYWKAASQPEVE
jgi:hypothetical protein